LVCAIPQLTTAQLLDFLRGDVGLALAVLQQLIVCASYEDDAVACALAVAGQRPSQGPCHRHARPPTMDSPRPL